MHVYLTQSSKEMHMNPDMFGIQYQMPMQECSPASR